MSEEIHQTEIDGVPVFWADVPGPMVGMLMFGIGRAHEPAAMSGITHLTEHLALTPLAKLQHPYNGSVEGVFTNFHASGNADELGAFFGNATANLSALPLDRLLTERRVLAQEAAGRGFGVVDRLLWLRFGDVGHGLLGRAELGLHWLGPQVVTEWAQRWFGHRNAVALFNREPPANLRFNLPPGAQPEPVPLRPIANLELPAHMRISPDFVAASLVIERTTEAIIIRETAERRIREILRYERGLIYDVIAHYVPLDATMAHLTFGAQCQPNDAGIVRDTILATLDELAREGVREDDLARARRGLREVETDPQITLTHLDRRARRHLHGQPPESPDLLLAEADAATSEGTARRLSEAMPTLLACGPEDRYPGGRLAPYPLSSSRRVHGRRYRPALWPAKHWRRKDSLVAGAEGVMVEDGKGHTVTVPFDQCVAYLHWEGGHRLLMGADGLGIRLSASDYLHGDRLVRDLDASVPTAVVACGEHNPLGLEEPKAP